MVLLCSCCWILPQCAPSPKHTHLSSFQHLDRLSPHGVLHNALRRTSSLPGPLLPAPGLPVSHCSSPSAHPCRPPYPPQPTLATHSAGPCAALPSVTPRPRERGLLRPFPALILCPGNILLPASTLRPFIPRMPVCTIVHRCGQRQSCPLPLALLPFPRPASARVALALSRQFPASRRGEGAPAPSSARGGWRSGA